MMALVENKVRISTPFVSVDKNLMFQLGLRLWDRWKIYLHYKAAKSNEQKQTTTKIMIKSFVYLFKREFSLLFFRSIAVGLCEYFSLAQVDACSNIYLFLSD